MKSLSHVWLFVTLWTVAHQAPLSMGSSSQEYRSGLPFPSPGDLPDPGIVLGSPALHQTLYHLSHQGIPFIRTPSYFSKTERCIGVIKVQNIIVIIIDRSWLKIINQLHLWAQWISALYPYSEWLYLHSHRWNFYWDSTLKDALWGSRFSSILSIVDQTNEKEKQLSQVYQVSSCKCTRLHKKPEWGKIVKPCSGLSHGYLNSKKLMPSEHMKNRSEFSSVFVCFVLFLFFSQFVGFCVQFWILWPWNFSGEGGGKMSICIWCYSLMWLWTLKICLKKWQGRLRVSLTRVLSSAHQVRFIAAVKVVEWKQWIVHVQKCKFMMDVCYKF